MFGDAIKGIAEEAVHMANNPETLPDLKAAFQEAIQSIHAEITEFFPQKTWREIAQEERESLQQ